MSEIGDLAEILKENEINLDRLKDGVFNGCPDIGSTRALCWRLLLGALPKAKEGWEETCKIQRDDYKAFVKDFIIHSETEKHQSTLDPLRYRKNIQNLKILKKSFTSPFSSGKAL